MVFVVCCLLYSTELTFRPAPPCMLYLPRRVLVCTPTPCCYMCWFFPRPLQIISRPSNPHRQLWLDGFQGRSLALDKVLDGYMSVVDWPVAQFYKARFSCNIKLILLYIYVYVVGFSCGAIPLPSNAAAGGLLYCCTLVPQARALCARSACHITSISCCTVGVIG